MNARDLPFGLHEGDPALEAAIAGLEALGYTIERVPRVVERAIGTPDALASAISGRRSALGLEVGELAEKSGVASDAVEKLEASGRGRLTDAMRVLDALGVRAVTLPHPEAMG